MTVHRSILLWGSLLWWLAGTEVAICSQAPTAQIQPRWGILQVEVSVSGKPLVGALVSAGGLTATSDEQGRVRLQLPSGEVEVTITAEGFRELAVRVRIDAEATTPLEASLIPDLEISEEVTVTATRSDRRIQDEPLRVEVIDREDIEEKALMTPGSVAMLLGETTGLRVQTTAPSLGSANVRIQGLRGRYSQLLSDGLPLYGVQGDSLSLLQVPPLDLGQVEVIKGAASALYGSSALGGVVNLVSQQPRARQRQILLNYSSQDAGDLSFWFVEPPRGAWAYTLLGGVHGQARQDLDKDGWTDMPSFRRGVFRPRLFWDNGKGRTLFATAGVIAEHRAGGTISGAVAPDGQPFAELLDTLRLDGGSVGRITLSDKKLLSFRASLSYRGEERYFGTLLERGRRSTGFVETVIQGTNGRHHWVLGGAFQADLYNARDLQGFDYSYLVPGVFIQDEVDIAEKVTLGLSGRVDHHSQYDSFFSPRLSLLWRPAAGWSARLSAGSGYFAPTPFTEETEETGLSRLQPLSGIVAERAQSASGDLAWKGGGWEISATLFGSRVRDPMEQRIVSMDRVALANAEGPVRTWGTELLVRYRREPFMLIATHNFTRSTEESPEGLERRPVPLTPDHSAGLNAIWEDEDRGRIGLEFYYTGRQPLEDNPYRESGRSYFLFGALFERRIGPVRLFLNLENLGNIRQTRYDPLVLPARGADGRWTVDAWAPLDGRVINGGIRLIL